MVIRAYVFFSFFDPRSLPLPSTAPPLGRSISTPPGAAPLFLSIVVPCTWRTRVALRVRSRARFVGATPRNSWTTARVVYTVDGVVGAERDGEHVDAEVARHGVRLGRERAVHRVERRRRGLPAVPLLLLLDASGGGGHGYRDTLRCTQDYPSTTASL
jgi:hypothetical protein